MTGESLNIKLRLDFSDVRAGVQKVKTQLNDMANTVKQSIPKINTESKKAEKALSLWWEKEADGEIVSIDCETEIKNNVYCLKAHVVINKNIALRQEIQFNYPNKPF